MNSNMTECLNDFLHTTTIDEKLKLVQFTQINLNVGEKILYEHYCLNEKNRTLMDQLCQQPEIKEFLNKTYKTVYETYYKGQHELPFKTDKFITIDMFYKEEENKLQQGRSILDNNNWKNNNLLSSEDFKKYKEALRNFFISIKRSVNDRLDELRVNNIEQKLKMPPIKRRNIKKNNKLKDIWNHKTRTTRGEEMNKIFNFIMRDDYIKNIMECTLGEGLKQFLEDSPNQDSGMNVELFEEKDDWFNDTVQQGFTGNDTTNKEPFCYSGYGAMIFESESCNINDRKNEEQQTTNKETKCETMNDVIRNHNENHERSKDIFKKETQRIRRSSTSPNSKTISEESNNENNF